MVKLTDKDILHVARLARLDLSRNELPKFQRQLSEVVDFVSQLSEINTEAVEPTSQTTGLDNVLRTDEAKPENCLAPDAALSGSEKIHNNFFVAGRVIKK